MCLHAVVSVVSNVVICLVCHLSGRDNVFVSSALMLMMTPLDNMQGEVLLLMQAMETMTPDNHSNAPVFMCFMAVRQQRMCSNDTVFCAPRSANCRENVSGGDVTLHRRVRDLNCFVKLTRFQRCVSQWRLDCGFQFLGKKFAAVAFVV